MKNLNFAALVHARDRSHREPLKVFTVYRTIFTETDGDRRYWIRDAEEGPPDGAPYADQIEVVASFINGEGTEA